ncbi:MAG: stage II sporulation protein P [Acutalibacteraceae bacterium]
MKDRKILKITAAICLICAVIVCCFTFTKQLSLAFAKAAVASAAKLLPSAAVILEKDETQSTEKDESSESTASKGNSETTASKKETSAETTQVSSAIKSTDFFAIPEDIQKRIDEAEKTASKDKKDGAVFEKQYKNEGVTDSYGVVRLKNLNKTKISLEKLLSEKADLSVSKDKPSVLIYHTHTTESYQILDRDFYAHGYTTRSQDTSFNMVRVGDEICAQLEANGFECIHDKEIHDLKYTGAYDNSKKTVVEYLKKYPSIQITLDIHRDAIEQTDGTKIKPTAVINGQKAAQIMIISGCQEEGNSVEDFPDWRYNLVFAVQLQNKFETLFPGITRPIFFSPRRYNMNLTRNSLLIEVGSDSNTLSEAALSGRIIGKALAELLKDYTE